MDAEHYLRYRACRSLPNLPYIFARSSPGTKYITNYNSLRRYLHFCCSIPNIILKLTDTATGTSHIRTILASINHVISGTIVLCTVGADSDLPDTIAIGNHHVPKLYGLPLLMPLWNKDYVVLECGVIAALEHRTLWCSGVHYLPTSLYNCQSI